MKFNVDYHVFSLAAILMLVLIGAAMAFKVIALATEVRQCQMSAIGRPDGPPGP